MPPSPWMSTNFTSGNRAATSRGAVAPLRAPLAGADAAEFAAGAPARVEVASTAAETVPTAVRSVGREGDIYCSRCFRRGLK